MANFPTSVVSLITNRHDGTVASGNHAADHNSVHDEVMAIENYLTSGRAGSAFGVDTSGRFRVTPTSAQVFDPIVFGRVDDTLNTIGQGNGIVNIRHLSKLSDADMGTSHTEDVGLHIVHYLQATGAVSATQPRGGIDCSIAVNVDSTAVYKNLQSIAGAVVYAGPNQLASAGLFGYDGAAAFAANISQLTTNASCVINYAYGLKVISPTVGHASGIVNMYGVFVGDLANSPSNASFMTNSIGVYVQDAKTYGIWIDGGMSRFDGNGTYIFQLPANAGAPAGGVTGKIPFYDGSVTRYIPYY